jgi:hypothetical protein
MRSAPAPITSAGAVIAAKSTLAALARSSHGTANSKTTPARIRRPNHRTPRGQSLRSGHGLLRAESAPMLGDTPVWPKVAAAGRARRKGATWWDLDRPGLPPTGRPRPCRRGGFARRPTGPRDRPASAQPEAAARPGRPRVPPGRRCSPEGSALRSGRRPRSRAVHDGAASGYAPCSHAPRRQPGREPTARLGSTSRESGQRAWCRT